MEETRIRSETENVYTKSSFMYLHQRSEMWGGGKRLSSRRKLILTPSSLPFLGSSEP